MVIRMTLFLKSRKRQDDRSIRVWFFGFFASLFALFELDEVYLTVDGWMGVDNVSWLLAYLCLATAAYAFCSFCTDRLPHWAFPGLVATAVLLVAIFPFGPGDAPELSNHFVPHNVGEIVFTAVVYGYVSAAVSLISFGSFMAVYRRSQGRLLARVRTLFAMGAATATVAFYAFRFVVFSLSYFVPAMHWFAMFPAGDVYRGVTAVAAILWCVCLGTSDHVHLTLARPVRHGDKLLKLRRLSLLRARVERFVHSSRLLPGTASWLDRLRDPDGHIYRTLIGILDGRRVLIAWYRQWEERPGLSAGVDAEAAAHLSLALQSVSDSLDFNDLVDAYCRLERTLGTSLFSRCRSWPGKLGLATAA
jgi:hypothetical protein